MSREQARRLGCRKAANGELGLGKGKGWGRAIVCLRLHQWAPDPEMKTGVTLGPATRQECAAEV